LLKTASPFVDQRVELVVGVLQAMLRTFATTPAASYLGDERDGSKLGRPED
jgi:hypothetical protein